MLKAGGTIMIPNHCDASFYVFKKGLSSR